MAQFAGAVLKKTDARQSSQLTSTGSGSSGASTGDDTEAMAIKCQQYIVGENFDKAEDCVTAYAKAGGANADDLKQRIARNRTGKAMQTKLSADIAAGRRLSVRDPMGPALGIGESVAVNGACLTVVALAAAGREL